MNDRFIRSGLRDISGLLEENRTTRSHSGLAPAISLFSLSLNEGNPTVMFEALGCGKPFIGTRVGGVPEVIVSDVYGLLVNPADPADLAGKILTALDRTWDQEAIVQYADRFTWNEISKEILKVYRSVL